MHEGSKLRRKKKKKKKERKGSREEEGSERVSNKNYRGEERILRIAGRHGKVERSSCESSE